MRSRWLAGAVVAALLGVPAFGAAQQPQQPQNRPQEGQRPPPPDDQGAGEEEDRATGVAGATPEEEELGGEGGPDTAVEPSESFPEDTPTVVPVSPTAGAVITSPSPTAGPSASIPLTLDLHGYYRTRAVWVSNVPVARPGAENDARDAAFLFQRLRLEPSVKYGTDQRNPIAALYMQIDGLDNVVWGDNERLASTALFAGDPSDTDIEGFERASLRLERAWLEFLIPVGQVRVGRMPSQWGLGILTSDGNGLGEWGDPLFGSTYDRLLFATRPLTIVNALTRGDASPTPLIVAVAYDKLVEDTMGFGAAPVRSRSPLEFLANGDDDVQEVVAALIWNDPDLNPSRASDELTAGLYFVNRWQQSTESDVFILDAFWRFRHALGPRLPSLYTAGEIVTIQGKSGALPFAGPCDPMTGVCPEVDASIWGGVARLGLIDRDEIWAGTLEVGYSSGDEEYFNDKFTVRALHPDYHVGLLLYQVAMATQTAIGLGPLDAPALWSRGGVWNSWYLWPQARYTVLPGIEVHGAFLLAYADKLNPIIHDTDAGASCGVFDSACMLGWEADLALRLKWGENDVMWWDTEFGIMGAGDALANAAVPGFGFSESLLWTLQTRIAMRF